MKNRKKIILSISLVVLLLMIIATGPLNASQNEWTQLSQKNLRLVNPGSDNSIVYEAVQEKEKIKLAELMDKKPGIEKEWKGLRPNVFSQSVIKNVYGGTLKNINADTLNIDIEDIDGPKKIKINSFKSNGHNIIAPADPEFSNLPYGLVTTQDGGKGVIPTLKGLWVVDSATNNFKRITSDSYDGKSFEKLTEELSAKLTDAGDEGPPTIWWNNNPVFNKGGNKIVFGTNRDCVATGGMSIWTVDLVTGKEQVLLQGNKSHYNPITWIDDNNVLCEKWNSGKCAYLICNISGDTNTIYLQGANPELIGTSGDLIAYIPNNNKADKIIIAKVNLQENSADTLYEKAVSGTIQTWYEFNPFSPDASKIALLYLADEFGNYNIMVADLNSKSEIVVEKPQASEARLQDFNWLDNSQLLVHMQEYQTTPAEMSTWTYNIGKLTQQ